MTISSGNVTITTEIPVSFLGKLAASNYSWLIWLCVGIAILALLILLVILMIKAKGKT